MTRTLNLLKVSLTSSSVDVTRSEQCGHLVVLNSQSSICSYAQHKVKFIYIKRCQILNNYKFFDKCYPFDKLIENKVNYSIYVQLFALDHLLTLAGMNTDLQFGGINHLLTLGIFTTSFEKAIVSRQPNFLNTQKTCCCFISRTAE